MGLRRAVAAGCTAALVVTGCAGEAGTTAGAGQDLDDQQLRSSQEVARAALALFDADVGVTAVAMLAAADRGYTPLQLVVAVEDGTLTEAGGIIVEGTVAAPGREAEDTIAGKPPLDPAQAAARGLGDPGVVVASADSAAPVTFDALRATFEDDLLSAMDEAVPQDPVADQPAPDEAATSQAEVRDPEMLRVARGMRAIGWLGRLYAAGYDVEQIILGIVGDLVEVQEDQFGDLRARIRGETPRRGPSRVFERQPDIPVEPAEDDATPDSAAEDTTDDGYALRGSISFADESGEFTSTWTGSFTVAEDGTLAGSGAVEVTSRGVCTATDGSTENPTEHPYAFTATSSVAISGSSDGTQLEPVLTPDPVSVSEGSGTDSGALCVDIVRDMVTGYAEATLGDDPSLDIVVPASGGVTHLGEAPFVVEVEVRPR